MKTKSGPHLWWPNIYGSNTGPTSPGDGRLALSTKSTLTQAFSLRDLRKHPDLTATSGEDSTSHDLMLRHSQPIGAPPPTRVATWRGMLRAARDVQEMQGEWIYVVRR
jgi:hypothetical protein